MACHVVCYLIEGAGAVLPTPAQLQPAHPYPLLVLERSGVQSSAGGTARLRLFGLRTRAGVQPARAHPSGLVVVMKPGRFRLLTLRSAAIATDTSVELAAPLNAADQADFNALHGTQSAAKNILVIEQMLRRRLRRVDVSRSEEIWQAIERQSVQTCPDPVTRLSKALGLSARSLQRVCMDDFGAEPSFLLRLQRFHRLLRAFSEADAPRQTLGQLARSLAYSDASHLCRETKALSGHTPGQLRETLVKKGLPPWLVR
jgi:AraC-like DNA-binding protein